MNGHIKYICACSNLRARNYKIGEVDFQKVKFIAGKIIPAIATTTAMIVGVVGFEIFKYLIHNTSGDPKALPIEKLKNSFHNLALPFFAFSETIPPIENKDCEMDPILFCPVIAIPPKWTNWDTLDVEGTNTMTIQGMIDSLKSTYKIDISMIISGTKTVWSNFQEGFDERLTRPVIDVYKELSEISELWPGKRYVVFSVSAQTAEGDEASTPIVRFSLST